jgi:hypothetical protein
MTQGLSVRQGFVRLRVAAVSLVAAALGVLVAGGASGASTLSIIPDATTYTVGDTITLDIVWSHPDADAWWNLHPNVVGLTLSASLSIPQTASVTSFSATQNSLYYEGSFLNPQLCSPPEDCSYRGYTQLLALDFESYNVVNQTDQLVIMYAIIESIPKSIATATFTATSPGQVTFGFNASTFDFFDAAPTSTATIEILPVPEPGTATLVGMGLASLSVCGRKRRVG